MVLGKHFTFHAIKLSSRGFFVSNSDRLATDFPYRAQTEQVGQRIKLESGVNDSFSALWEVSEKFS